MDRTPVEQGLVDGAVRLRRLLEALGDLDQQLAVAICTVEDVRLQAIAAETPAHSARLTDARRLVDSLNTARQALNTALTELRTGQDLLLERLPTAAAGGSTTNAP